MKARKIWSRNWLKRRTEGIQYKNLVQELALEDENGYRNWMRLDRRQFHEVLELIRPAISRQDTNMRAAVSAEERLAITLRHLATGESQQSLSYQFRVSQPLISMIIPSVCTAIYEALQPDYMRVPTTQDEWRNVAAEFHRQWNYPNCLGACDGNFFLVAKPANSGSSFYDYKGHCSVILMALVDAQYKFLYVDVGTNGRVCDGGVSDKCTLKAALENNDLKVPPPEKLPFSHRITPFVIVADDAFPLKQWIMKPYPGKDLPMKKLIHNYRLSRARRVSENAFGILVSRFQIFRQPIRTTPERVEKIALATTVLHNYLRENSQQTYTPPELLDREDIDKI
ncbi:Protein ALP1-like [Chionoecetes opilio]|uniref:Protein ALP1-like n=1 Tax=Chionoecetes opilio TaxID=41210 RepID=A0A8J4YLU9_CHIOP|nr:Protein ALP1-like [Chionoecetes opilio]